MKRRIPLMAVASLAIAAALAGSGVASPSPECVPGKSASLSGRIVLARGQLAFVSPRQGGYPLYGCFAGGEGPIFAAFSRGWFPRPALDIDGDVFGFTSFTADGLEIVSYEAADNGFQYRFQVLPRRVGGLRIRGQDRLVAWITCGRYVDYRSDNFRPNPNPDCRRNSHSLKRVFIGVPGQESSHLIALGRTIDPHRLEIHENTLTWRNRGHVQRFVLPPPAVE